MSGAFFNLYLHQNYLDFFSLLDDVERASEYLSDADLLTAEWTVSLLGWQSRNGTRTMLVLPLRHCSRDLLTKLTKPISDN